jgi:DNA-binding transcriptional LysR family regulator
VEISTPSFFLAPQLVVGTDRIATITTRLALKYAEILPIKLVPLPIEIPVLVELLHWHRAHNQDPAHLWFRQVLKAAVAALPSPETQPRAGVMASPSGWAGDEEILHKG